MSASRSAGRYATPFAPSPRSCAAPLPARVASVRYLDDELTLVLRSGVQVRLGDHSDRALKLELARRLLPRLVEGELYLDVSVPERPVAGTTLESQVEVEPSTLDLTLRVALTRRRRIRTLNAEATF